MVEYRHQPSGGAGVVAGIVPQADLLMGIEVPAGQRRCKDLSTKAYNNASVDDVVMAGHKVKFIFLGKLDGASEYIEIGESGPDPVSSYSKMITKETHPSFFPGVFRTCARNPSNKLSTVSLTLTVDKS
jgi:hypothetical protein